MPRKRIPFIACEFPVFDAVPAMAVHARQIAIEKRSDVDLAHLEEHRVGWGLMKLWKRCWESKVDVIHAGMVDGYVPGCLETLILFDFAERLENNRVRIKGLDRYIRVRKTKAGEKPRTIPSPLVSGPHQGPDHPIDGPLFGPKGSETAGKIEDRRSKTDQKDLSLGLEEDPGRRLSWEETLWADMTEERIARLEVLNVQGPDHFEVTPERLSAREVNVLLHDLGEAVEELAGESFSDKATEISGAWRHFLIDSWGKKLKPEPFTLRAFCSPKVYPRHWRAYNETALGGVG